MDFAKWYQERVFRFIAKYSPTLKIMSRLRDIEIKISYSDQSGFKITLLKRINVICSESDLA